MQILPRLKGPRHYSSAISDSLAAWLRGALSTIPGGLVEIETNLGGLDEAGNPSPDLDWVGMVAAEFTAPAGANNLSDPDQPTRSNRPLRGSCPMGLLRATGMGRSPEAWALDRHGGLRPASAHPYILMGPKGPAAVGAPLAAPV